MKKVKRTLCCICGTKLENFGNNPDGARWKNATGEIITPEFGDQDRCCDACNSAYVLPGRIYQIYLNKQNKGPLS